MSDIDPRELIILFEDLTKDLRPALNDHIDRDRISTQNVLDRMYRKIERESQSPFNATDKLKKAKAAMKDLFYHLNQKYLSELRKDEDKQAEFMYSTYALNENVIKKDPKLLREIIPFVQTALIRLYIDMEDEGREKIFEFFN